MINRVSIILAHYCPHCVPFSLRNAEKMANDLGVPLRVLDIEIAAQELLADKLVEKNGDWSDDYLIPQFFVEYDDGRVTHLLTGFSEAVSATESAWEALFSSCYYKNLVQVQDEINHTSLRDFVYSYLSFSGQCRKHCDDSTSLIELWSDRMNLVGAYVCPGGYISRVIHFSTHSDRIWFKNFLSNQGVDELVNDRDLRLATRHGWELERDRSTSIRERSHSGVVREVYWTTYPKTDEEKRRGVFLCSNTQKGKKCQKLFIQNINSSNRLCPKCS
jgi:hypothetical protein